MQLRFVFKNFNLSKSDSEIWFKWVRYSLDGRISAKSIEMIITMLLKAKEIDHKPDITSLISPKFVQMDYALASPFKLQLQFTVDLFDSETKKNKLHQMKLFMISIRKHKF